MPDPSAENDFPARGAGSAPFTTTHWSVVLEAARPESAGRVEAFARLYPCAELAADLGMSEGAVKVTVHRLRQRYGELLRAEVARTVGNDAAIADELHHLIELVSA